MKFLNKLTRILASIIERKKFGFISFSGILTHKDNLIASELIISNDQKIVREFEDKFANMIGSGYVKTYSAGRMGFYELMKVLNVGKGDEVIVNSGNCSVMINAIYDKGAKPIFSDVDLDTFGSCPYEIEKKISGKTKMIVAQHSFGIPCKIDLIRKIASKNNIFLLEDCALSFQTKFKNIVIGNFGDAALFSFDHTKPLNGFSGGAIYTTKKEIFKKLELAHDKINFLTQTKQRAMLKRHTLEQRFVKTGNYKLIMLFNLIQSIKSKFGFESPYLDENSGLNNQNCSYAYPSKMPSFIAKNLCVFLDRRWEKLKNSRKKNMKILIKELADSSLSNYIPKIYFEENIDIVPLRLILYNREEECNLKKIFSSLINLDEIWFQTPIISTNLSSYDFGLNEKEFPKSVKLGNQIMNLPLDINENNLTELILRLKMLVKKNNHLIN